MQYWKPSDTLSAGDPMPHAWDDAFHLLYLVDEEHHALFHYLGGHQWAHAVTRDLIHWEHLPLAVPRGEPDTVDQYGICTGSVFRHDGRFHAFYATRTLDAGRLEDPDRVISERVCVSLSDDGVHFTKHPANPILSPPPQCHRSDFRDPHVFADLSGEFYHMVVSARLDPPPLAGRGGILAHYTSRDLWRWEPAEPFLGPGLPGVPECPDLFEWNGWCYLTFLLGGQARYRMARSPLGPWTRPPHDLFGGPGVNAMKSAPFGRDRRIGVGFLGTQLDGRDDGGLAYAGSLVFREILQRSDGTLLARLPAEMGPTSGAPAVVSCVPLTPGVATSSGRVRVTAPSGMAVAAADGVPPDARTRLRVTPEGRAGSFGLAVRGDGAYATGYELRLTPAEQRASLSRIDRAVGPTEELGVEALDRPFGIEVVMCGDAVDVCIDQRHCLIRRVPELRGERLFLFAEGAAVTFEGLTVAPIV
ncbi:MAG: hypothetical protein HYU66_18085 [Armatimonadetes bacterium]|nr:hypothetical protein [Armatimonadota bacterium]